MAESKGRFVWYELLTTDVEGAKAFYGEVVGWKARKAPGPMEYTMFYVGEDSVAGLMAQPEQVKKSGAPPAWLGYIAMADVDQAAKQVVKLGGKQLMPPADIPNVGRFAVVADPQGAAFALFASKTGMQPRKAEPRPGDIGWHELNTTDYEAAWKFYSKLAGWKHSSSFEMGPEMGTYWMFESGPGEATRGGMSNVAKAHHLPPHWSYYITVPDVDAAAKRIKSLGGTVLNGPMDVPGGDRILQGRDPQGAAFALYTKKT
jgi:uncharacterized protein